MINAKTVTYDFERMMPGPTKLKCWGAEFADAIIRHMSGSHASVGSVEPKGKPAMAGA